MIRQLPVFKGYTIDVRLRQFRRVEMGEPLEFIDFESPEGDELLVEYIHSLDPQKGEDQAILSTLF